MRRVHREWLKRIGRYVEGDELLRRLQAADGEHGQEGEEGDDAIEADSGDDGEETDALPDDFDDALSIPEEVAEEREREQEQKSEQNRALASQSFQLEGHYLRNLASRFARMISKVAEDAADFPTQGDDEWDVPELLQRRFTGRHINQCRMIREKRRVVVVLDTSPSCLQQAQLFRSLATVADELGDCELYDAPNFAITARKVGDTWESFRPTDNEWHFEGRVVLAFGDFDGIDRISRASSRANNKIYWFCCEERPYVLESNREQFVQEFRGHYFVTPTLNHLMHSMRRVR